MSTTLIIIFILLLLYYSYFLVIILKGLGKLSLPSQNYNSDYFVSVIIPFRNESGNILKSLASLENQNFPMDKYEVIYVDDNSTDDSFNLIEGSDRKANVKILKLPYEDHLKGNKKRAVQYGIENCRGEIIVTTDADCIHHKNWLKNLVSCFDSETAFVSGPVEFSADTNIFSNIQKLEFEGLVLAGAGLIGSGKPTISNGANIAFKRNAYLEAGGINDNLDISSGDDVFLMQNIYRLTNHRIKFCNSSEAVVFTEPNRDIRSFFNQRKRWASKSFNYEDKGLIFQLILIFLFYSGLVVQLLLVIAGYPSFVFTLILSLILKITLEYLIIKRGESLFFPKNKFFFFLMTELVQIPYIIITSIGGLTGHFTWKGRKIKR